MKRRSMRGGDCPNDDNGVDEDFISQLPDEILVLIISLIPTKTAITTSILSQRWRNVYKYMSIFDLDHRDLSQRFIHSPDCELIIDRMERLLSLCSHSKIEFFTLKSCSKKLDQNKFEQCIHHLGNSGIEYLMVHLSCRESCNYDSLPCHFLLELPSLKELLLKSCSPQPNINIKFQSLSVLYLSSCTIVADFLDCILSNCLSLHSLILSYCKCPPKLSFRGSDIGLKNLEIRYCEGAFKIELYAKNLTKFECLVGLGVKFDWVYVPGLETVFFPNDRGSFMHEVFIKLPKYAPTIKELSFCIAGGFFQERTSPIETITFGNLRRLDITVFCESRTNLHELTPYLQSHPLLEELYLNLSGMNDDDVGVQDMSDTVLYRKLKFVEISGFRGKGNEITFALYILKSAVALKKMWITRCFEYYVGNDIWWRYNKDPWSEETLQNIKKYLEDQALSTTAELIIRHKSSDSYVEIFS